MTSRSFLLPLAGLLLLGGLAGADDRKEAVVEMEKANAHLARHEYEAATFRLASGMPKCRRAAGSTAVATQWSTCGIMGQRSMAGGSSTTRPPSAPRGGPLG